MKSIKELLLFIIFLTSLSLSAQTKLGVTAGAAFANVTAKSEGISMSPKMKTGFTAGLFADIPLTTNFSFQPALNFVQKGFKIEDETESDNVMYNYLEVPLNFVFRSSGFFIGAGPSISYGLSGKEKYVDKTDPTFSEETKINFGSGDEEVKSAEFGANILTGYQTSGGFMFSVNYNFGLTNLANGDANETGTIKNKYFAFKIGYIFNSRSNKYLQIL